MARMEALADRGSLLEIAELARSQQPTTADRTPADGAHTALARIGGREVMLIAEDAATRALTDGEVAKSKRLRAIELAMLTESPVVFLADGGRDSGSVRDLFAGELLGHMTDPRHGVDLRRRQAPLIAVAFGPTIGHFRELLAEADFVIATPEAQADLDRDGGDGGVDLVTVDDLAAIDAARQVLLLLASPQIPTAPALDVVESDYVHELWPQDPATIMSELADDTVLPLMGTPAGLAAGLCRVGGRLVVVVVTGGGRPSELSLPCVRRLAHLVRFAGHLDLPLVLVQDCAGYGDDVCRAPREVVDLIATYRQFANPKVCIVTGAGHVLGNYVLGGHELGIDITLAWPWARLPVSDTVSYDGRTLEAARDQGPWMAAGFGLLDDVVTPSETAPMLRRLLAMLPPSQGWVPRERFRSRFAAPPD
jgi:acetyl-CoA carboxylase carboxyltransferase component